MISVSAVVETFAFMIYYCNFALHVVPADIQPFESLKYCFLPLNDFKKPKMTDNI